MVRWGSRVDPEAHRAWSQLDLSVEGHPVWNLLVPLPCPWGDDEWSLWPDLDQVSTIECV